MNVPPRAATTVDLMHPRETVALGEPLTPVQTRYLAEYAIHGDCQRAADCIGSTLGTLKRTLHVIHRKTGTDSSIETMYRLGWINVPVEHALV